LLPRRPGRPGRKITLFETLQRECFRLVEVDDETLPILHELSRCGILLRNLLGNGKDAVQIAYDQITRLHYEAARLREIYQESSPKLKWKKIGQSQEKLALDTCSMARSSNLKDSAKSRIKLRTKPI
jgi:hypothetical protein